MKVSPSFDRHTCHEIGRGEKEYHVTVEAIQIRYEHGRPRLSYYVVTYRYINKSMTRLRSLQIILYFIPIV